MQLSLFAPLVFLVAYQINLAEFRLVNPHLHYRVGMAQTVTLLATILTAIFIAMDVWHNPSLILCNVGLSFAALIVAFILEWILSRITISSAVGCWLMRFSAAILVAIVGYSLFSAFLMLPNIVMALYVRHTPFGIPYGKDICLARFFSRSEAAFSSEINAHEMEYAGKKCYLEQTEKIYNVKDYGIKPNSKVDQTVAIQKLVDHVGEEGGGCIFFPAGQYRMCKDGQFLQINHSHITIKGECDENNSPQAELLCCSATLKGKKNPWLSPFFISTGEELQPSNEFFGVQFRKRKRVFSSSGSLSDPGSDGSLLTPDYATLLTTAAKAGDSVLKVEDSTKVGKYIILALYNTTTDGNLVKDILGVESLRPEWTTANRAGEEEAPSYQWLVEVAERPDEHTIRVVRPLLRDCPMKYQPAVFNVDMLEDINIVDIRLKSIWNGQFRHHGFPLYYSVSQSQEMDYGWNAINMKRVAHGNLSNVVIENFTNPLYILDSRNITAENLTIKGYDGHQGIKLYQHACDNFITSVRLYCHFADMMGGEGNAYGNVFHKIQYLNPVFKPVDFDFHGFSEGPMSPPSDNLFVSIRGFRNIQSAAAKHMLPGAGQRNVWRDWERDGYCDGDVVFLDLTYRPKTGILRFITAVGYAVAMTQKSRKLTLGNFYAIFHQKLRDIDATGIPVGEHYRLFPNNVIES